MALPYVPHDWVPGEELTSTRLDIIEQGIAQATPVVSVAGRTGAVSLVKADVGLGNVDNTSDATKFTSTPLTGTPTAPTATAGTSTTQVATTAFVTAADALKANLASPPLTGTPTAPTAAANTNTTQVATTAFVTTAINPVTLFWTGSAWPAVPAGLPGGTVIIWDSMNDVAATMPTVATTDYRWHRRTA